MNSKALQHNLSVLFGNPYPGRGFIIGLCEAGIYLIQIYWVMGRGDDSRNRVLTEKDNRIFTEIADLSKLKPGTDTSLLLYNAMLEAPFDPRHFAVSNGIQTDAIPIQMDCGNGFESCLRGFSYETDPPNNTPRITAVSSRLPGKKFPFQISLIKKSPGSDKCIRHQYDYEDMEPGTGRGIHTYIGDSPQGQPLDSYHGEPRSYPIEGSISRVTETFERGFLNNQNFVSLVVKFIPIDPEKGESAVYVRNRYKKMEA